MTQHFATSYSYSSNSDVDGFAHDVLEGLSLPHKRLKPMYFYDVTGSMLFERICLQPEYYLTRTELAILKAKVTHIIEMACAESKRVDIIELGSGSSLKTRILFRSLLAQSGLTVNYFPIDISYSALVQSANTISEDFPNLQVNEIVADYGSGLKRASELISQGPNVGSRKRIILFLGSSIGNMSTAEATQFLTMLANYIGQNDSALIGFDLEKDKRVIERAYNDRAGVTKLFNLNLLDRINRELGGNFDIAKFEHRSFYNVREHRIEMHLVSLEDQTVSISALGKDFVFKRGETIHTENSYKYSPARIKSLAQRCGLVIKKHFTDPKKWYDLCLLGRDIRGC